MRTLRNTRNNARRHAHSGFADGGMEQLEQRSLLSGLVGPEAQAASRFQPSALNWHGVQLSNWSRGSWVMTFQGEQPRALAETRAAQVLTAMGITAAKIEPSPLGRFARIQTSAAVTEAQVAAAKAALPFLHNVEPDLLRRKSAVPNDAEYPQQWPHHNTGQAADSAGNGTPGADIKSEEAWNISTGSNRVVVAIVDTGVDLTHPDLRANIWRNPGEIAGNGVDDDGNGFVDDVNGWDFVGNGQTDGDNNPQDPQTQGHGTAVAGVVGAVGNNALGVAGVNWTVSMIAVKIFPDDGLAPSSAIINAQEYLVGLKRRGVPIVASSNSYGSLQDEVSTQFNDAERLAIQSFTNEGMIFVAAAGNDTNDNDSPTRAYPSSYDNPFIVSAAATTNKDTLAGFSNFGATTVDLGAPGERVRTTQVGGGYQWIDGTSFACPYTAGVLGLMASVNRFATQQQLRTTLLAQVDPVPALTGKVLTGGRLNAFKAVRATRVDGLFVTSVSPGTQATNVTRIEVEFSGDVNPAFFSASKVELVRANGTGSFALPGLPVNLSTATVTLTGRRLTIDLGATPLPRDLFRLTLKNDGFRDADGKRLNGDLNTGNDEVYDFNVVSFRGPFEPNDTLGTATPLILAGTGQARLDDLFMGDGDAAASDVDIFRVFATGPSVLTADVLARRLPVSSSLDSYLRVFDGSGRELARNDNYEGLDSRVEYFIPAAGDYYLAVSAYPNTTYQPATTNGRTPGASSGSYSLSVQLLTAGPETITKTGAGTPVPVPAAGSIVSTITVTDGRTISDLAVRLTIAHTFVSDLRVTLTGPDGTAVTLFNRRGGSGQNLTGTVFRDSAGAPISGATAPFTGTFRPEQELTPFKNRAGAGTWTLRVEDLKPLDAGSLTSWSIDFTHVNDVSGPFELNDTLVLASDLGISGTGSRTVEAFVGDGAFGLRDVDLYRFVAGTGTTITASTSLLAGATGRLVVRLFDGQGHEVRADRRRAVSDNLVNFVVANAGVYYVGVSGGTSSASGADAGNDQYDPLTGGSGTPTDGTSPYTLTVAVAGGISEGPTTLAGSRLSVGVGPNGAIGLQSGATPVGVRLDGKDFLYGDGALSSYFGAIYDTGFIVRNTADGSQSDVPMAVANESDFANRRAVATGLFRTLGVRRAISFGVSDQYLAIDVTLTNRSQSVIANLAWLEGFGARVGANFPDDPENIRSQTINNIDNATHRLATSRYNNLTLGLAVPTQPGGYTVVTTFTGTGVARDPYQVLTGAADPDPSGADAGVQGTADMVVGVNIGTLAPDQAVTFRYFLLLGNTPQEVATLFANLEGGTGSGHLVRDPGAGSVPAAGLPYAILYPEGYANSRASTFLPIVNGQPEGVRVVVIARYEAGGNSGLPVSEVLYDSATDEAGGKIRAGSRAGITLTTPALYTQGTGPSGGLPGRVQSQIAGRPGVFKDTPYALEIRSSAPVGATMSHYDFGITTGQSAVSTLATTWTFADVRKGPGINDFLVFVNPGAVDAAVTLSFYGASGAVAGAQFVQGLAAGRRGGWAVSSLPIPDGTYAVRIDSSQAIVAALTHFDSGAKAGYGAVGLPLAGAAAGGTAQGQIGLTGTSEIISVFNPSSSAADVTVNFAFANSSAYRRTISVPAGARRQINVGNLQGFPRGQAYGITYTSTQPVTVNLPSQTTQGASGATLTDAARTQWLFGEGFRPAGSTAVKEYLRIFNPAQTETTVEIQMNYNNGTSEVFRRTVASRSTADFDLFDFVTGTKASPGTVPGVGSFYGVRVLSSTPIVAFTGHFDSFLGGGFGYLGTPLGTVGSPS